MNRLKRSLLLTLIASGLLLSGARNALPLQQSRNQGDAAKTQQKAEPAQEQQTISPAFYAAILGELRALVQREVAERKQDHADHEDWHSKPFWLTFGLNAALVLVGTGYTVLAYLQWRVIRGQTKIARIAMRAQRLTAYAADKSAEAARLALNANRPYVFAESFRLEDHEERQIAFPFTILLTGAGPYSRQYLTVRTKWLSFQLHNRSNGVTIIEAIHVRAAIVRRTGEALVWESTKTQKLVISQRVIAPNQPSTQGTTIPNTVVPPIIEGIFERFGVIGFVRYRDVYDPRYKSTFAYYYRPPTILLPETAFFYLAGERHNRLVEIK